MVKAMKNVIEITENEFNTQVLNGRGTVLVDFYAPWCGPCRMLGPILERLAIQLNGRARIVKVNVDESPALAMQYGITGVPTLMLFRNGVLVDTWVGLPNPRELVSRIEEIAGPAGFAEPVNTGGPVE